MDEGPAPPLASPSERTPLFAAAPSTSRSGALDHQRVPGAEYDEHVEGPRQATTTFGNNPSPRERAWYRAKQFKSLLISLFVCSIIAVLIVVAVIASHNNVNKAFPGEVNSLPNETTSPSPSPPAPASPANTVVGNNKAPVLKASAGGVPDTPPEAENVPGHNNVTEQDLADALAYGRRYAATVRALQKPYRPSSMTSDVLRPEDLYRAAKTGFDVAKLQNYTGYVVDAASSHLARRLNLTKFRAEDVEFWNMMPSVGLMLSGGDISTNANANATGAESTDVWTRRSWNCSADEKYRRIDGFCNNLANPRWGAAGQAYRRLLPPDYDDGVSSPRVTSSDGTSPLPGARTVSRVLHRADYREEPGVSMLFVMWGQFLDHDMESSVVVPGDFDCCPNEHQKGDVTFADTSSNNTVEGDLDHRECFPLLIDSEDFFYAPRNVTCISISRDAVAAKSKLGPRQQMNANTAFLDASMVYGSSEKELSRVRDLGNNGSLATVKLNDGRKMLPLTSLDGCSTDTVPSDIPRCHFGAGDARAEENMGLTSFHTLWVREHNRVAEVLARLNPKWDDERLFQEARRVVVAQMQHITVNEYLPILLGRNWESQAADRLSKRDPSFSAKSKDVGYREDLDPSIANEFAGAAFRFGHSTVQGLVKMIIQGQTVSSEENIPFHEMQFNTSRMYGAGQMDGLLQGYSQESCRRADRFFTSQLTNHLFETRDTDYGLDLVAINVHRGRDRGIPPYNAWREFCGLSKLTNFSDLDQIADKGSADKFQHVYKSVEDIDAYTGMVSERRMTNSSMIGPTLHCLISEQFFRLKNGDRFWYDSKTSPNPFTPAQLVEIKKASLAGIICRNSDKINQVSPSPMLSPRSKGNDQKVSCSSMPLVRLVAWEEFNLTASAIVSG